MKVGVVSLADSKECRPFLDLNEFQTFQPVVVTIFACRQFTSDRFLNL